jgi:hypothetical protein
MGLEHNGELNSGRDRMTKPKTLRKSATKKATTEKKARKPKPEYATEIPPFVYEEGEEYKEPVVAPKNEDDIGTVLLVKDPAKPKRRAQPVRYVRRDFPRSKDGETAFWDYKIAVCEYRKAAALRKADPLKKRKDKLSRMLEAVEMLKKQIASEEGSDE